MLRPGDSLARLSGDEFVILCEDLVDRAAADPIAVRLDAELSRPFMLSRVEMTVSASIGIAFTGQGIDSPEELFRDADLAMYRSKRGRIRTHEVLDLRELHLAGHQAGLARGLPGAIGRGELHLAYQPIVDAADGQRHRRRGAAALDASGARAGPRRCSSRSPSNPGRSSNWAAGSSSRRAPTATAGKSTHRRRSRCRSTCPRTSSCRPDLRQRCRRSWPARDTDPGLLTLEVTESVFVRDEERALVVLEELKEIGVKLALDDFGTGYSSLGYLNTLPIDTIKVDQTFIAKLSHTPGSRRDRDRDHPLAHSSGCRSSAEGVETAPQHQRADPAGL